MTATRLPDRTESARVRVRAGIRRGAPFGLAVFLIAVSYGVLARPVMGTVARVAMSIVELLAAALLAALVVVETFGQGRSLTLDARVLGVAFAAIALLRRVPITVAVLGAAVVTAATRALF